MRVASSQPDDCDTSRGRREWTTRERVPACDTPLAGHCWWTQSEKHEAFARSLVKERLSRKIFAYSTKLEMKLFGRISFCLCSIDRLISRGANRTRTDESTLEDVCVCAEHKVFSGQSLQSQQAGITHH